MALLFDDRHVVVTGGTGALGTAVVGALARGRRDLPRALYRRGGGGAISAPRSRRASKLVGGGDLTDEAAVEHLYDGVPKLWASIHSPAASRMAPIGETTARL